jgi:glycosyltransferase involved in cell wall biosynthesis
LKRILILSSSYPLSANDGSAAAGVFVRDICMELVRQGARVVVITQARAGEIEVDEGIRVLRFPTIGLNKRAADLKIKNPVDLLAIFSMVVFGTAYALGATLQAKLTRKPFDHAVAFWAVPAGLWAFVAEIIFGLPYRVWTLGSDIWVYGEHPLFRKLIRLVLRCAEKVFSDGLELQNRTSRIGGLAAEFLPSTRLLPLTATASPFKNSKLNFVFIGRFHFNKGIDLLIEAIRNLPAELRMRTHFTLFGDGDVSNRAKDYGLAEIVTLPGYAGPDVVASYLEHAHCLIIPSRIESIPVVFSDALQKRCPIIATNVGDMGGLLSNYKVGLLTEPNSIDISNSIIEMATKTKQDFNEELKRASALFDIKKIAARVSER